jgi:hypothetical protein
MTVTLTPKPLYYSSTTPAVDRYLPGLGWQGWRGAATVDAIGGQLCAVEQRGDPLAIVVARRHLHDHEEVGVLDQAQLESCNRILSRDALCLSSWSGYWSLELQPLDLVVVLAASTRLGSSALVGKPQPFNGPCAQEYRAMRPRPRSAP